MFFTRLKIMIFALSILVGFSVFVLYKLDAYLKDNLVSSLATQVASNVKATYNNVDANGVHDHDILNTIKDQQSFKQMWLSFDISSVSNPKMTLRDAVEKKAYVTKDIETQLVNISATNDDKARISVPIIAQKECLACHENLKLNEVVGVVNTEFILHDNVLPIITTYMVEATTLLLLAAFVLMMSVVITMNSLTSLVFNVKSVIQSAIEGNFTTRIKKQGVGVFSDVSKVTDKLLETLDRSINSIDAKIASIFIYKKSLYSSNPLIRITELIAEITNLFIFKTKIENTKQTSFVYKEIQLIISRYIKYKYLIFVETNEGKIVSGYRVENGIETKIVAGEVKNIEQRLNMPNINVLFDDGKGCLFVSNSSKDLNVIDLKVFISKEVVVYYSIILHSKKELLEKENSVSRVYNYIREMRPIVNNIILVKSIEESSYTDPLTKAYNRLYLEKYIETINEKLKQHIKFGVMMIDIDHFKKVNDTYGHHVGDAGIVMLTESIRKVIRASDKIIRYGGEEFVVILESVDFEETYRIAEKIRNTFSMEKKCSLMELTFPKSASIGISSMPFFSKNIWECINQADIALYVAKESGRNRVVKYSYDLKGKEAKQDTPTNNEQQNNADVIIDDDEEAFLESLKLNN